MKISQEIILKDPKLCFCCPCYVEPEGQESYCSLGYELLEMVRSDIEIFDMVQIGYTHPRPQKCIDENGG